MAKKKLSDLTGQQVVQYYDPSAPTAGIIQPFAGSVIPSGWLLCDGQEVSQTVYASLFAVLSTTYNTQTNPTTNAAWAAPTAGNFRVPDLRGIMLKGVGTPSGASAVTLGGYQADQNKTHTHTVYGAGVISSDGSVTSQTPLNYLRAIGGASGYSQVDSGGQTGASNNSGVEVVTRNRGVNYIIKCFNPTMVSYNGGMAGPNLSGMVKPRKGQYDATVTGTGWTTSRAKCLYYQDQDGNHRMKFNIAGSCTSTTRTAYTVAISGVVFVAGAVQACSCVLGGSTASPAAYVNPNTGSINVDHASVTTNAYYFSGDVELASKPAWA